MHVLKEFLHERGLMCILIRKKKLKNLAENIYLYPIMLKTRKSICKPNLSEPFYLWQNVNVQCPDPHFKSNQQESVFLLGTVEKMRKLWVLNSAMKLSLLFNNFGQKLKVMGTLN